MSLFKKDISKKELEKAFNEIQMNLENNYKDLAIKAYKDADLMLNNYHKESKIDEKTYTKFKAREWKVTVIVLMLSIRRRLK